MKQKIRKQFRVRNSVMAVCLAALCLLFLSPAAGEDGTAPTQARGYIAYDDISNTIRAIPETGATDTATGTQDNNGHGNNADGVDSSNPGQGGSHDNNGHGNNADGVDSSNPGQGGPNGRVDESCDGTGECVDDEIGNGHHDRGNP